MILKTELPYPPSINHYYIRSRNGVVLGARAKKYRKDVMILCNKHRGAFTKDDRLSLTINAFPPDKRWRDLDNLGKAIMDGLEHAGVFPNDNQIDVLNIIRRSIEKPYGLIYIWLTTCSSNE